MQIVRQKTEEIKNVPVSLKLHLSFLKIVVFSFWHCSVKMALKSNVSVSSTHLFQELRSIKTISFKKKSRRRVKRTEMLDYKVILPLNNPETKRQPY